MLHPSRCRPLPPHHCHCLPPWWPGHGPQPPCAGSLAHAQIARCCRRTPTPAQAQSPCPLTRRALHRCCAVQQKGCVPLQEGKERAGGKASQPVDEKQTKPTMYIINRATSASTQRRGESIMWQGTHMRAASFTSSLQLSSSSY